MTFIEHSGALLPLSPWCLLWVWDTGSCHPTPRNHLCVTRDKVDTTMLHTLQFSDYKPYFKQSTCKQCKISTVLQYLPLYIYGRKIINGWGFVEQELFCSMCPPPPIFFCFFLNLKGMKLLWKLLYRKCMVNLLFPVFNNAPKHIPEVGKKPPSSPLGSLNNSVLVHLQYVQKPGSQI